MFAECWFTDTASYASKWRHRPVNSIRSAQVSNDVSMRILNLAVTLRVGVNS